MSLAFVLSPQSLHYCSLSLVSYFQPLFSTGHSPYNDSPKYTACTTRTRGSADATSGQIDFGSFRGSCWHALLRKEAARKELSCLEIRVPVWESTTHPPPTKMRGFDAKWEVAHLALFLSLTNNWVRITAYDIIFFPFLEHNPSTEGTPIEINMLFHSTEKGNLRFHTYIYIYIYK